MDVQYSPAIRGLAGRFKQLEAITPKLSKAVAVMADPSVHAEWDLVFDEQGRELYRLSLLDTTDRVSTDFTSEQLNVPHHMTVRLHRLCGDLLQIRSDKQHAVTRELFAQMATDEGI